MIGTTTISGIKNKVLLEDDVVLSDNRQHWPLNTRKQSKSALGRLVTTSPPKRFKKKQSVLLSSKNSSLIMIGSDSPYYANAPWLNNSIINNPSSLNYGKQFTSNPLTQSPIKKKSIQDEPRITLNTMTNSGGVEVENIQFSSSPALEKKRGSLSLEGSSIDKTPPQKEIQPIQSRISMDHYSPEKGSSEIRNSSNSLSPSKKETKSNIAQNQDSHVKKITFDIVMPSMNFYQIENKEAFDQHYRYVSPTPIPSKSVPTKPPKYETYFQSRDYSTIHERNAIINSLEIENINIRSVNNSTAMNSIANLPQTKLPNIHNKKDILNEKHINTISLANENQHRRNNNELSNTKISLEESEEIPPQTKPNPTPTISCTALSGFIFSKVHGVQNLSPISYSKRYNPTTHIPTAKKPYFNGNAKKPYNGLMEVSSFTKTRKKPLLDSIVR